MPEPGLFGHLCSLQGIVGECKQIILAVGLEVGDEWTELITEHALRQADLTRFIIGGVGFIVTFKVDKITAQVEPRERVRWICDGSGLG